MNEDISWKIKEAAARIKDRYHFIGHQTGAPFLAIVFPQEAELWTMKEWRAQAGIFADQYDLIYIDLLEITTRCCDQLGVENIIAAQEEPMPGADPEAELANLWISEIITAIKTKLVEHQGKPPVLVIEKTAALYPVAGPRFLLQQLWDMHSQIIHCPVVVFIPGRLLEQRVYLFLNTKEEFMYRGDIL
ncbi:MAG TPA: DUF1788 domain-containing protein [Syntrophales bacterium]|nr:DUF1788 domain-containing protein [Smithellaceae bacterium]HRR41064.1 DUF1788 domain-containing protein [Syntrophales bacterium]